MGITARVGADAFVRPATLSEAKGSVLRHADCAGVIRAISRCYCALRAQPRTWASGATLGSQFPPDVLEIVEAFLAHQPLGGADGAFGEAAAGFGVVAEINSVGRRFEDHFVQAHDFTFAERRDLEIFVLTGGFA